MPRLLSASAILACLIIVPAIADAQAATPATDTTISSSVAPSNEGERTLRYWTPERMRKAKPMELPTLQAPVSMPKPE